MKAAISVKSPFSQKALFGFAIAPSCLAPCHCVDPQLNAVVRFRTTIVQCAGGRSMPERRHNFARTAFRGDRFARRPGNFADSPGNRNGRLFRDPERGQTERRCVLHRGILRSLGIFDARVKFIRPRRICSRVPEHLVLYHLVIEGGAVVELADGQTHELRPGDVVIFPHGDAHHMSSGNGAHPAIPELRDYRQDQIARPESITRWRRR